MTDPPRTHYLNSDFDLSLRPRPRQLSRPGLVRQVRELSVQALLGAKDGDAALVRAELTQEFPDYLGECGLCVPRILTHPQVDPARQLRPFGWSAEAIESNRLHLRPARHPPLATVRRVNGRTFSRKLAEELDPGGPHGAVVESPDELETMLSGAAPDSAWILKSEHGNAALANRRLAGPRLAPVDRRFVEERLVEDDRMVIEPWLERQRDWCVVFEVPFAASAPRIHEVMGTRDGALIGSLFDPGGADCGPWSAELVSMAERVASKLSDEGYFGPVCVDAFVWRDADSTRLRPLVDLNCRLSMSDGAHRLWQALAPERTLYYRFFNRRKFSFPEEFGEALAALGPHRYDRDRRRGILLASPLRLGIGADAWRPGKLVVIFVGDGRAEIATLEQWFREQFEV